MDQRDQKPTQECTPRLDVVPTDHFLASVSPLTKCTPSCIILKGCYVSFQHVGMQLAILKNWSRRYVPLKLGKWFESVGVPRESIVELDWWQQVHHRDTKVTVSFVPAQVPLLSSREIRLMFVYTGLREPDMTYGAALDMLNEESREGSREIFTSAQPMLQTFGDESSSDSRQMSREPAARFSVRGVKARLLGAAALEQSRHGPLSVAMGWLCGGCWREAVLFCGRHGLLPRFRANRTQVWPL